ncbi:hypothetical protein ACFYXQ_20050 [Nocardia jiangxiensis]|uniref:Uncharacterized protein n=1 Tax=Nocardia jiangxiensis TaxID=282685 RepID=A0ABW6S1A3_9NOCA
MPSDDSLGYELVAVQGIGDCGRIAPGTGGGNDFPTTINPGDSPMTMPAMPAAVMQSFAASQSADADAWADAFAVDGVFHDPVGEPPIVGAPRSVNSSPRCCPISARSSA